MAKPRFMMRAGLYGASLYAAGLYSGVGVSLAIKPEVSITVPLNVRGSLRQQLQVNWWAELDSLQVRTSSTIDLGVRRDVRLPDLLVAGEDN